jgi:hypothetical protein
MMKRLTVLMSVALVVALFAGPAFALDVPGLKHHVTGNISRIDNDSKTFTVTEDKTQKSYVFSAKDPGMLRAISRGEHVRVAYSKHGTELVASKVEPKTNTTASRR